VVTVQRAFHAKYAKDRPTEKNIRAWYRQFSEIGCLCKQKSSGLPLTAEDDVERVRASFVTRGAHIEHLWLSKKLCQVSCGCEQIHQGRSFCFLVINVCNHGEHYETPGIIQFKKPFLLVIVAITFNYFY